MNLGDVVGQLLRDGLSPQTQGRLEHAIGGQGLGGILGSSDLDSVLGGLLGGQGGRSGGGLGDLLGSALGQSSGGAGQLGGIGALAGALLGGGGGSRNAAGGSAMALLGTLALSALNNWQAQSSGAQAPHMLSDTDRQQIAAPETAELCLRGMIEAIKSDGEISSDEVDRLLDKLQEGGITAEEKAFVEHEMNKPADLDGLLRDIPGPQVGIQVYTAALMAISIDTVAEQQFMARLAAGIGLNRNAVDRLHQMVGAPIR